MQYWKGKLRNLPNLKEFERLCRASRTRIKVVKVIFSGPKQKNLHLASDNQDFCCKSHQLEEKRKKKKSRFSWVCTYTMSQGICLEHPPSSAAPFWPMHLDFHPKETSREHCRRERMRSWLSLDIKVECRVWIKQLRSMLLPFIFMYAERRWAASMNDHMCHCWNMNMNFLVNLLQNCLLSSQ